MKWKVLNFHLVFWMWVNHKQRKSLSRRNISSKMKNSTKILEPKLINWRTSLIKIQLISGALRKDTTLSLFFINTSHTHSMIHFMKIQLKQSRTYIDNLLNLQYIWPRTVLWLHSILKDVEYFWMIVQVL